MSHHAAELLAGAQPLWTEAAAYDEARRLLRLALLRDLVRTLHAERSRLMALRQPDRAETLKKLEPILERLRTCELDSFDLAGLVNGDEPQNPLKEEPQDPRLDRILGEGKLDRYDRAWEAAMAVEALKRGWLFWALDTQVEVPKAEAFHLGLGQRLWPAAIVLYVEASPGPPAHDPSVWSGRWIVTSRAGWIPPKETLQNLPASRGSWTRLGP